jgi:translation initiation factor IF-3
MQVNHDIKARRVLVIDETGNKIGEFLRNDALSFASEKGLDLVQVSQADTPTCKLMDYGKYVYDRRKQEKSFKGSDQVKVKEVRISPRIADGDFNIRISQAKEFLKKGLSIRVLMKMKGPDLRHPEIAQERCQDFITELSEFGSVDEKPKLGNKIITFTMLPKKDSGK